MNPTTRRWLTMLTGLLVALSSLVVLSSSAQARDRDCGDFSTQAAAQRYFIKHGGPDRDPDNLDADGDGIACESNPCPCSTAQGGGGGGSAGDHDSVKKNRARVVKVVDGDTVDVKLRGGPKVRVRLLGIDTPEVYGGVECGGPAASKAAKRMLPRGTPVLLVSDPSQDLKDRYGRLLRYVSKHGKDINRAQINSGHATVYVYQHHPFRRVDSYRRAQRYAKSHNLGIWKHCR